MTSLDLVGWVRQAPRGLRVSRTPSTPTSTSAIRRLRRALRHLDDPRLTVDPGGANNSAAAAECRPRGGITNGLARGSCLRTSGGRLVRRRQLGPGRPRGMMVPARHPHTSSQALWRTLNDAAASPKPDASSNGPARRRRARATAAAPCVPRRPSAAVDAIGLSRRNLARTQRATFGA